VSPSAQLIVTALKAVKSSGAVAVRSIVGHSGGTAPSLPPCGHGDGRRTDALSEARSRR
jgi:hypothetical protein